MGLQDYRFQSDFARRYFGMGREEGKEKGKAEGKEEGKAEGKDEGKAEAILTVLESRGVEVAPSLAARVRACHDPAQLDTWLRRAATASRIDDLLVADA